MFEHPYFRAIIAGGEATPWIAEIVVHERFRSVERDFWRPILRQAIDVGEVRADRDVDVATARRVREQLLAETEASDTVMCCGHVAGAVFGRILPGEGQRMWQVAV